MERNAGGSPMPDLVISREQARQRAAFDNLYLLQQAPAVDPMLVQVLPDNDHLRSIAGEVRNLSVDVRAVSLFAAADADWQDALAAHGVVRGCAAQQHVDIGAGL